MKKNSFILLPSRYPVNDTRNEKCYLLTIGRSNAELSEAEGLDKDVIDLHGV